MGTVIGWTAAKYGHNASACSLAFFDIATTNLRVGETILLSLLVLGEAGPAQANPTVLHKVIKSLRNVGLDREARALAVEAAVASGL